MKKFTSFLIALVLSGFVYGQSARMGYSKWQIKSEFGKYISAEGVDKYGQQYVRVDGNSTTAFYYFDENEDCNGCIIYPNTENDYNVMVNDFNKRFKNNGQGKWTWTSEGETIYIEESVDGNKRVSFIFHY